MLNIDILLTPCNADNGDPAGLYSRQMLFEKAGDCIPGHLHPYDHPTLFAAGEFDVEVEGVIQHIKAPHQMLIRKDKRHKITATTDNALAFCIHIVRDAQGGIVGPGHLHLQEIMPQIVILDGDNNNENTP